MKTKGRIVMPILPKQQTNTMAISITPIRETGQWLAAFGLAAAVAMGIMLNTASAAGKPKPLSDAEHYNSCMAMIDRDARRAFDDADNWILNGGGEAAKHCAAAALLSLGFAEDAAQRLETLAKTSVQDDAFRAAIYDQSGTAWTTAKKWDKANAVQSAAITLAPKNPAYRIARAKTRALAQNYGLAVDDLTAVLDKDASNVEAHILRASAYRYMDAFDLAREDIDAALKLQPENPEALLESGILHRLSKEPNKARQDWAKALLLVEEKSDIAGKIRRNIELLEFPAPNEKRE